MAVFSRLAVAAIAAGFLLGIALCAGGSAAYAQIAISPLQAARALKPPVPALSKGGEFEGYDFWEEYDDLLKSAWQQFGPLRGELYSFDPAFERRYLHSALRGAAAHARGEGDESEARGLFEELLPGVFKSDRLFTADFLEDLQLELQHIEDSGIPRRRPNGMNRYGVILDQVGLEAAIEGLAEAYFRPLAAMLFPELVGPTDAEEHYAFTVKYEAEGDTELAKHGDASVVTINLCLGRAGWRGGELRFFESAGQGLHAPGREQAGTGDIVFSPGMAVLHRGQHKHQALPLLGGQRTNVIIWLMGKHGVVRIAPYPKVEQLSLAQRWANVGSGARADLQPRGDGSQEAEGLDDVAYAERASPAEL